MPHNKLFKVRKINRYAIIDTRSGSVQVVYAKSQHSANYQALRRIKSDESITVNA